MTTIQHPLLGPYTAIHDISRLYYGRLLWRRPGAQRRLLAHWQDERHPYRERFTETYRPHVERVLASTANEDCALDEEFRRLGMSLRSVVREIPPVFGSFY
jgi:hypothetical protein